MYTPEYYRGLRDGSRASAELVAPWLLALVQPRSVVDVGCGTAAWAAAFKRLGVPRVRGIDGPHVDPSSLAISADEFLAADLARPLPLQEQFDLAVALEVAEHLPPESAGPFVETLTRLAPVVLFSAAIPHQGGEHHVNEQWPRYWVERFAVRDFVPLDIVRPRFWSNPAVEWWYAQNALLFLHDNEANSLASPFVNWQTQDGDVPDLVHPKNYERLVWQNRVLQSAVDLASVVAPAERLLLVDEGRFGELYLPGRRVLPFPELDGQYAGPPPDDGAALAELDRRLSQGADFLTFGWPAFWWLDHYSRFANSLRENHRLVLQNDRLIVFRLL